MFIKSKLPDVGTTIFSVMSKLAKDYNAINLSQGFPNFDCPPTLQNLVTKYISQGMNQYAPMTGVAILRERLAQKIENLYGLSINADTEITITAGATQAIYTIISAFVHADDEVIIIEPAYDSYGPSIEVNGGKVISYQLLAPDFKIDWLNFRKLVSPKTKMIIINSPHNPTGSILSEMDMQQLEEITQDTDIIVLSDEVYEHLIYDHQIHQSVFKFPNLYQRSMAVFSFGKTFHSTGWKIGYCVGPDYLMKEFRKVHQFNVFSVNTPTQYAIAEFLENPSEYLGLPDFYQQKRDYFAKAISNSQFQPLKCSGTYFQLYDYSAISELDDVAFAKWLTIEHGVATIPVSVFSSFNSNDKLVRFCFAKTEDTLDKAAELINRI